MTDNEHTVMGHLALHYRDGDDRLARLLLEDIGCVLVDNGPSPGRDGFCTVLLDAVNATFADNLFFLSKLDESQQALEDAITAALHIGTAEQHPAVTNFFARRHAQAESIAHFGIRYGTFEQLEAVLARLERDTAAGGPLHGRVEVQKRVPPPRFSAAADQRIADSPLFTGDEAAGPAKHWVQCRFITDIIGFGLVSLGAEFELDYVFEEFYDGPVSFARAVAESANE